MKRNFEKIQPMRLQIGLFLALFTLIMFSGCGGKEVLVKKMEGNQEIVTLSKGKEVIHRIVYTIENGKRVQGELWIPLTEDEKKAAKAGKKTAPKTNILANTAIAKKYAELLKSNRIKIPYDPELGKEENGFKLMFAQRVQYNEQGLPKVVMRRGISDIPVVGRFQIKTDLQYKYNGQGYLDTILEKNMNVDTLLLKFGFGNVTKILRDGQNRPITVTKGIGSIPPTAENTKYFYKTAEAPFMDKTVYDKVGLSGLSIKTTETITIWYDKNIPWNGPEKFSFTKSVAGLLIWDHATKKNKLDASNIGKMNLMQKAMFFKQIYDLVKAEMMGPQWRMGELADTPIPFADGKEIPIFGDYSWFN